MQPSPPIEIAMADPPATYQAYRHTFWSQDGETRHSECRYCLREALASAHLAMDDFWDETGGPDDDTRTLLTPAQGCHPLHTEVVLSPSPQRARLKKRQPASPLPVSRRRCKAKAALSTPKPRWRARLPDEVGPRVWLKRVRIAVNKWKADNYGFRFA